MAKSLWRPIAYVGFQAPIAIALPNRVFGGVTARLASLAQLEAPLVAAFRRLFRQWPSSPRGGASPFQNLPVEYDLLTWGGLFSTCVFERVPICPSTAPAPNPGPLFLQATAVVAIAVQSLISGAMRRPRAYMFAPSNQLRFPKRFLLRRSVAPFTGLSLWRAPFSSSFN